MIDEFNKVKDDTLDDIALYTLVLSLVRGVIMVCAGLMCHSGFYYIAHAAAVPEPNMWMSISFIFVLNQLRLLLCSIRLWGNIE